MRYFDVRVSGYIQPCISKEMEYWCGHSFLSVPLDLVIHDFVKFIKKHPSEVVIIDYRPDTRSLNGDIFCMASNEYSQVINLNSEEHQQALTQHLIQEIGKEHIAFDFSPDMTVHEIVNSGKNIVLFNFGNTLNNSVRPNDSWPLTKDYDVERNFDKCKEWARTQVKRNDIFS